MPEAGGLPLPRVLRAFSLSAALAAPALLGGCLYATGGIRTFRIETAAAAAPAYPVEDRVPSRTEIAYARDTARVLFRRKPAERTREFVTADPAEGFGLCVRSGPSNALLLFPRRILEPGISQAADDVAILRSDADTAPCRRRTDWVPA